MPEGELAFGDESGLARVIREAIGADPYERVEVVTPQFERTDGRKVTLRPNTAEQLDKIKKLPHDILLRIGVGVWDKGEGWTHYVFPGEWYECIPAGYPIVDIFGDTEAFQPGETDDDIRFGCLSYGWVEGEVARA